MAITFKRPLSPGDDDDGDDGSHASSSRSHQIKGNGSATTANGSTSTTANGKHTPARKQRRTFANAPGTLASTSSSPSPTPMPSPAVVAPAAAAAAAAADPRIVETRNRLPISTARRALVEAIQRNETVIVLADTGSGKSTQIPQYLHAAGFTSPSGPRGSSLPSSSSSPRRRRFIGVTQPRRMAATALAKRVGHEIRSSSSSPQDVPSSLVEYAIRFQDRTTPQTRIKFMTDGWLLREVIAASATLLRDGIALDEVDDAQHPALLPQYTVLVIDEAHERSVRSDLVLGLAKRIQARRRELRRKWQQQQGKQRGPEPELLRLVIMSATLDAELFSEFFAQEGDEGEDDRNSSKVAPTAPPADPIDAALAALRQPSPSPPSTSSASARPLVPAPVLYVKGRTHPVSLHHLIEPASDWIDAAKRQILQLHVSRALGGAGTGGDILVFGTGSEEIEALAASLRSLAEQLPAWAAARERTTGTRTVIGKLLVVPLYAALGAKAVADVFKPTPPGTRKVVIATNIAETSVTIPGVRYVVDCGLAKERMHISHGGLTGGAGTQASTTTTPSTPSSSSSSSAVGIDTLTTRPISQSAAAQRAGRAGREAPGECYRLYPRAEYDAMERTTLPEIHRTELSSVALDTFAAGVDPREVEWVDPPQEGRLEAAVLELAAMGAVAVDSAGPSASEEAHTNGSHAAPLSTPTSGPLRLTPLGRKMSLLPLPPRFALMLITASEVRDSSAARVVRQARDLVAILSSERGVFLEPRLGGAGGGAGGSGATNGSGAATTNNRPQDAAERLEEKRAEAERAKSVFRHASGDHITLLRAFYAYRAAKVRLAGGNSGGGGANGRGAARRHAPEGERALRSWCANHYISLRSMREIEEIRAQLDGICRRAGIILGEGGGDDGEEGAEERGRGRLGKKGRRKGKSGDGSSSSDEDEDDSSDSDSDPDPDPLLTVTRHRPSHSSLDADAHTDSELGLPPNEDYTPLLRCLLAGRSTTNLAVACGPGGGAGTGTYRRLCGPEEFKLHPTCALHGRYRGVGVGSGGGSGGGGGTGGGRGAGGGRGGASPPRLILFEELVYTTQLYVRCASEVLPEWLVVTSS